MMRRSALQRGIALPVMLIMLVVMLISSIYLLRSGNSTALTTSNLAYETALTKAADLGIHTAYSWLDTAAKETLWQNVPAQGYVATMSEDPDKGPASSEFWAGSVFVEDDDGDDDIRVEYVIHRLCQFAGAYNGGTPANRCATTAARQGITARTSVGDSLASDAPTYQGKPQLHYVITARIHGKRGGNVMNQAVVMMGP